MGSEMCIRDRHVRSEMKTASSATVPRTTRHLLSHTREKRIGASAEIIYVCQRACIAHAPQRTLTSSSFFITFLIRASGSALLFPFDALPRL